MDTSIDAFFESVITVKFGPDRKSVDIIDQTEAPGAWGTRAGDLYRNPR